MKKFFLLFFSILISCLNATAEFQNTSISKTDSLKNLLRLSSDTNQINILIELSSAYLRISPQKSIEYGDSALVLALNYNNKNKQIKALNKIGSGYYFLSDFYNALNYYKSSLRISKDINNKQGIANAESNIGLIYDHLGKYDEALKHHLRSLEIEEELGNKKGVAGSLNNIGNIYCYMKNYDKALEYFKKALQIAQDLGDREGVAQFLNNIGIIYAENQEFESAILYYQSSLIIYQEADNKRGIASILNNIGYIFFVQGDFENAMHNYQESQKINRELGDQWDIANTSRNIGGIYLEQGKYYDALPYFKESLNIASEIGSNELLQNCYHTLSELYLGIKDYKKSLEYFRLYSSIKDSIYTDETGKKIAELQLGYEIQKKDKENEILQKNNEIQTLKIKRSRNINILIIAILLLILLLILYIYSRYRIKIRTNKLLKEKSEHIEKINEELMNFNEKLETRVNERTKALQEEILERKQVDIDLKKALKNAEDANYLKNAFLANMSHEIRTPLNGIIGFSSLLASELSLREDPELYEYAEGIEKSGDRLLHLLNNILDISRIEANDMEVKLAPCQTNEIVKNISELYSFKANEKGLKLNTKYNEIPNAIADEVNLTKIISDVIDNAIKYTEKGFINVITDYDPEENQILIIIKDTGIGIDEAYLKHIFETFSQESLGYSREFQGAGLGLPLAKRIIELMGGKIKVESKKAKGTAITLFIKAETEESIDAIPQVKKEIVTLKNKTEKDKIDIFIVEDDKMNRMVIEKMLDKIGNNISAVDGEETIKIIEKNYKKGKIFEIMLFDINLPPPWDGIKLKNEIKKRWPEYNKIPFVAQTAYAMSGDKERLLEAGFDSYISKPVNKNKLINIIYNQLKIFQKTNIKI